MSKKIKVVAINVVFILVCVIVAYAVSNYLFTSIDVDGVSMKSTLQHQDRILLLKVGGYQHGDVVVFNSHIINPATGNERYLVKRIIGLPTDTIEIIQAEDGKFYVYRNGERLTEDYLDDDKLLNAPLARLTVSEGEFFYLGDNRPESDDSRSGKVGKLDSIVGRVVFRYKFGGGDFFIRAVRRVK